MSIDINTYAFTPATVFDLNGECYYSNRNEGVPCRIKVGPRRWLEEYVIPEKLGVTIWQEKNGQTTYLRNEPVQTSVDKNGVLTVDMATFAQEYFGKEHVHFCDSDHWKWHKRCSPSGAFLTADHGVATHRSAWLDISVHHSDLYLMPGTLNLCGHDVRHIYWETFCDELANTGASMRPLTETILRDPHTISAKEAVKRLKKVPQLKEWGFNRLAIRTDRGSFGIGVSLARYLSVELQGVGQVVTGYEPKRYTDVWESLEILLQMLQASNAEEIRAKVDALHQSGLLTLRKDNKRM